MKRALGQKTLTMLKDWATYYTAEEWAACQKKVAEVCAFSGGRMMNMDPKIFAEKESEVLIMAKEASKLKKR